jgi:membrane protein YdbS with pleckstrin-like domain
LGLNATSRRESVPSYAAAMPYDRKLLHANEDLVLDLHPHWWYFAKAVAALVVTLGLGIFVLSAVDNDIVRIIVALFVLVSLGWFAERYLRWISTNFVLTTDRVIWREGVFAKRGVEIPLDSINVVHFSQRIFERMLGLGDLRIESAAESGATKFTDIPRPNKVQNEIYLQMEANENRKFDRVAQGMQGMMPAQQGPSIPEQIEHLARLRDQGHITPQEYEAKKAELLGRM